jgi:altronate dehydratase
VLQKIERRAIEKMRELIDFDVSELIDDELMQARKRRRVMR